MPKQLLVLLFILLFVECFGQTSPYRYGMGGCGYAGTKRKELVEMEKMVADNDTAALHTWLFSEYKELNAYAVEGYPHLRIKALKCNLC